LPKRWIGLTVLDKVKVYKNALMIGNLM